MALPTLDSIVRSPVDASGTITTIATPHTSSGSNRVVLNFPQTGTTGIDFSSSTYDAGSHTVAMTNPGTSILFGGGAYRTHAFHLAGQATGANECSSTAASIPSVMGTIVGSFNGVNQTTPVGATVLTNFHASSGSASISTTLAVDELLVMHTFGAGASTATTTSGTQILNQSSGTWSGVFWCGVNSGVGTVGVSCNWDVAVAWGAIAYILKPTAGLTAKFSIPTNAANGTVRTLFIWADTTMSSLLVPGIDVTASGGFFKFSDASATLGGSFPAMLTGFGSSAAVDAFGASAWATGIAE